MNTSKSLLETAKRDLDSEAWFKLHRIYDPLIAGWIVRSGVDEAEVSDITQEVLTTVSQELPRFEHNGRVGAFRNWLKLITINRCRRYWDSKKKQVRTERSLDTDSGIMLLNQLEDPNSDVSQLWDTEHDSYVFEKLVELIRSEFDEKVYEVFVRNTLQDEAPKSIGEDLGFSVNAIYKMKFRVMKRLREVAEGILDDAASDT